tara:strand:- start:250 stop:432 length:183 start_codon:yes stop_codon:yes gene_type:complete
MKDRYFIKSKDKFSIGNTDIIIKYDSRNHDIVSFEDRFIECDADGKEIKPKPKAKAIKKD